MHRSKSLKRLSSEAQKPEQPWAAGGSPPLVDPIPQKTRAARLVPHDIPHGWLRSAAPRQQPRPPRHERHGGVPQVAGVYAQPAAASTSAPTSTSARAGGEGPDSSSGLPGGA